MTLDGKRHHLRATADQLKDVTSKNFTPERINNPAQDEAGRYQSENLADMPPWLKPSISKKELDSRNQRIINDETIRTWTYSISEARLYSHTGRSFRAVSGKGKHKNNPDSEWVKDEGPVPLGWYLIVARRDENTAFNDIKQEWFMLLPLDYNIGDDKTNRGFSKRGNFRLHHGTISEGCITILSRDDYETIMMLMGDNPQYLDEVPKKELSKPVYAKLLVTK